jgi:hypothetical protein
MWISLMKLEGLRGFGGGIPDFGLSLKAGSQQGQEVTFVLSSQAETSESFRFSRAAASSLS